MGSQIIADHTLQTISVNTVSGATSYVYNAVSTVNSVQQSNFEIQDNYNAGSGSTQFGLQARTNSTGNTFYAMETSVVGASGNGTISIVKSVAGTVTTLATYTLPIALSPATEIQFQDTQYTSNVYNMKFLVQTDTGNTSLTDLKAELWQQGTAEPTAWEMSTTDGDTNIQGTGYGGIWETPIAGTGLGTENLVSGYAESTTGDPATITNFSASPTDYTGSYPATVTFNASATYAHGTVSSYSINFGDGTTPVTTASVVNLTHSYTAAPAQAYTAVLTVTDSTSGTIQAQQEISANTSVTNDPTGTLALSRIGGNGITASNPLLVNIDTSGTPHSGTDPLVSYILNFGDGTSLDMPIPSGGGTGTLTLDTNHLYTTNARLTPTLTLVASDGATTIVTFTSHPTLLISSTPPTVAMSFNTTTSILTAVFSEDVGAALVSQTSGSPNYTPEGEPLWTDGSFGSALDVRNDNNGGSVSVSGAPFAYNSTNFTATWNLNGLVNSGSTSYTARLFATGIQDQAGNDLDGINSGIGGQDAKAHFGQAYPSTSVTLSTSGAWNTSMPLVFAPTSGFADTLQSLTTATVNSVASTQFTFPNNATINAELVALATGDTVIIEDFTGTFAALNGIYAINKIATGNHPFTFDVAINSSTLGDSGWVANSQGSFYFPAGQEVNLIGDLEQIVGITSPLPNSIPTTGLSTTAHGVYVGLASEYDTGAGDLYGYNKTFDETNIGQTTSIVRSTGSNLYLLGGGPSGEDDAIETFLQGLGYQLYGPDDASSTIYPDVWQITPSISTLSGSWDIYQSPTIGYLDNSGGSGGWATSGE